jgi:hypothetical protein
MLSARRVPGQIRIVAADAAIITVAVDHPGAPATGDPSPSTARENRINYINHSFGVPQ